MKYVKDKEIRIYSSDNDNEYEIYVLGKEVRKDILDLIKWMQSQPYPSNFTKKDLDTLYDFEDFIKTSDFNRKQWSQFMIMVSKYESELSTLAKLAKMFSWEFGENISYTEVGKVMQQRRDEAKAERTQLSVKERLQCSFNTFDSLYE